MFLEHMNLVQTDEFDWLPCQTKGCFFLHATFTVFWLNIAFIAVHSGEHCGPWASGFLQILTDKFTVGLHIKMECTRIMNMVF